jgi:quercetin dioxygenase-like cupin family protein
VKINRSRESGATSEDRTAKQPFSGTVWADAALTGVDGVSVNDVFFGPGGRTYWHRHAAGQVLLVTHGRGRVQTRAGEGSFVEAGDVVFFEPGEEHWHGATGDTYLLHRAISLGETEWLEEVDGSDYGGAVG